MVSEVLVPMDDSEMAERALTYALETHPSAEITVFHVVGEPSPFMAKAVSLALSDDYEEMAEEQAAKIFDRARELAADHDVEIETEIGYGQPAKAIIKRASEYDVVIMGSHGGSIRDTIYIGNVAKRVFRHSPVPVTTVR